MRKKGSGSGKRDGGWNRSAKRASRSRDRMDEPRTGGRGATPSSPLILCKFKLTLLGDRANEIWKICDSLLMTHVVFKSHAFKYNYTFDIYITAFQNEQLVPDFVQGGQFPTVH